MSHLKEIISILIGILTIVGFGAYWWFNPKREYDVESLDWLPATASDISYIHGKHLGGYRVAEFSISRDDFLAYAHKSGWTPEVRTNVFVHFRHLLKDYKSTEADRFENITVARALYYEKRLTPDEGMMVVFDQDANRCHLMSNLPASQNGSTQTRP